METTEYQLLKSVHLGKKMRRTLEPLFLLTFNVAHTVNHQSREYSFASTESPLKVNN